MPNPLINSTPSTIELIGTLRGKRIYQAYAGGQCADSRASRTTSCSYCCMTI